MSYVASNMTFAEEFRMTGTLRPEVIERLIDSVPESGMVDGIKVKINEASGMYPSEDFLQPTIDQLREIASRLRGRNRDDLLALVTSIDNLAQCTHADAEYGRSELREALSKCDQLEP